MKYPRLFSKWGTYTESDNAPAQNRVWLCETKGWDGSWGQVGSCRQAKVNIRTQTALLYMPSVGHLD